MCNPRFSYENCDITWIPSMSILHYIFFGLYVLMLLIYGTLSIIRWREFFLYKDMKKCGIGYCKMLSSKMRGLICIYSVAQIIHHGCFFIDDNAVNIKVVREIFYNVYCVGMLITSLLLVHYWVKISVTLQKYEKSVIKISDIFVYTGTCIVIVYVIITDTIMFKLPETQELMVDMQYGMWSVFTLIIGISFVVFGKLLRRHNITTRNNVHITDKDGHKQLLFQFKVIYIFYLVCAIPNSTFYILAIILLKRTDIFYTLWLIIYILFYASGLIYGLLLVRILRGNEKHNKKTVSVSNNSA